MPNYTFDTFSMNDLPFPSEGNTFVHDSAYAVTTIVVSDDDPILEDVSNSDEVAGAAPGQTKDTNEILQSINGDTSISGNDIASAAHAVVTGDDGTSFKVYLITGSDEGPGTKPIDGSEGQGLIEHDYASDYLLAFNQPLIDGVTYTFSEYNAVGNVAYADFADQGVVCFTRGTLIKTDQGERPIEELAAGDMVLTMDHGYQPIRWIGSTKRSATGDLAPILIRKGALGNDRDLRVSPQHRMLLQSWQAEMLFGELEVLTTAKSLLNDHSILRDEGGEVEYFHMLFDTHEIIYAEGCLSESFHPGKQGWKALDQATRDEILTLFPQLADGNFNDYGPAARMSLKHKEGKLLGSYMAGSSPSTKKASSSSPTWLAAFSLKLVSRLRPSGWFQ